MHKSWLRVISLEIMTVLRISNPLVRSCRSHVEQKVLFTSIRKWICEHGVLQPRVWMGMLAVAADSPTADEHRDKLEIRDTANGSSTGTDNGLWMRFDSQP